jgi:hypothetical protein
MNDGVGMRESLQRPSIPGGREILLDQVEQNRSHCLRKIMVLLERQRNPRKIRVALSDLRAI